MLHFPNCVSCYYYYYYYYSSWCCCYKLQLSCDSMAVVLTQVQTKGIRINIHKKLHKKHSTYKYTCYQNTHTLQNKLKQPKYKLKQTQYKVYPNEIVTIQSSTLSIRSPLCTWHFYPQELHCNSLHFTLLESKITSHKSHQFTPHHFTYFHSIPT